MNVDRSDLEKIHDALRAAAGFHTARDGMNSYLHMAPQVRFSPLTSTITAAADRLGQILQEERKV